jgi:hypothetical protein
MCDLQLSRRLCIIKSSRATIRVKRLRGEKNNVSRTISVLVLRGAEVAGDPIRVIYIPARAQCSWLRASQWGLVGGK